MGDFGTDGKAQFGRCEAQITVGVEVVGTDQRKWLEFFVAAQAGAVLAGRHKGRNGRSQHHACIGPGCHGLFGRADRESLAVAAQDPHVQGRRDLGECGLHLGECPARPGDGVWQKLG